MQTSSNDQCKGQYQEVASIKYNKIGDTNKLNVNKKNGNIDQHTILQKKQMYTLSSTSASSSKASEPRQTVSPSSLVSIKVLQKKAVLIEVLLRKAPQ